MEEQASIHHADGDSTPHYEPYGWHHWPAHPWMAYQFRRALGETQEGGGAVSEVFQTGNRIDPGDLDSWHAEWLITAERAHQRGDDEFAAGHLQTARNCWLRATNYYRSAEFWLEGTDPRRLATFDRLEEASQKFMRQLTPPAEIVRIPYEDGAHLDAYFLRSPVGGARQPVLIAMGGLDSFKDELWFIVAHGALQRGIAVLAIDGPGQGGTLRRQGIVNRHDTEVPVGYCIDWLEARGDVDPARIAVSGTSLGGYYAARAACREHRLAACISHGAVWDMAELWEHLDENAPIVRHLTWVFGCPDFEAVKEKSKQFTLDGVIGDMRCPYLIVHGGYDVLGVAQATKAYDGAARAGTDATLRFVTEEETGADHCQHDNPTIGQELMCDWLADRFGIDQAALPA